MTVCVRNIADMLFLVIVTRHLSLLSTARPPARHDNMNATRSTDRRKDAATPARARNRLVVSCCPPTFERYHGCDGRESGQTTLGKGDDVRTGVTAILPHDGNLFQEKVPAAIFVGNASVS